MVARVRLQNRVTGGGNYFTNPKDKLQFISSGCTLLDLALGGGWAESRISNIVGDKSTGKTLLCIEAAANFIRKYPKGQVKYREAESAFDLAYAMALGMPRDCIDPDVKLETVEDMFEDLDVLCKRKHPQPILYIVDSLDALSDRDEMAADFDAPSYGAQKAKALSKMFRQLVRKLEHTNITVIIVSQVRDNIGAVGFQKKTKRSGGHAMDFYCTHVLELANLGKLSETHRGVKRATGVKVKGYVAKNKVSLPYREAEFPIQFGYGVDDVRASLNWLKDVKGLKEAGYPSTMTDKVIEATSLACDADDARAIKKTVTKIWYELEQHFVPVRRKYEEVA